MVNKAYFFVARREVESENMLLFLVTSPFGQLLCKLQSFKLSPLLPSGSICGTFWQAENLLSLVLPWLDRYPCRNRSQAPVQMFKWQILILTRSQYLLNDIFCGRPDLFPQFSSYFK